MKLKGIDILNLCETFSFLSTKEMDLNTAVLVAKVIQELSTPKQVIDDKKNNLIFEYALKKEDGEIDTNADGTVKGFVNKEEFEQKLNSLLSENVCIEDISPLPAKSLSSIKISPQVLFPLIQFNLLREEN